MKKIDSPVSAKDLSSAVGAIVSILFVGMLIIELSTSPETHALVKFAYLVAAIGLSLNAGHLRNQIGRRD